MVSLFGRGDYSRLWPNGVNKEGIKKVEIDIKEQEEKLKTEAQNIGEQLGEVQKQMTQLQQRQQFLINEALKNQGALDLIKSLNGSKSEEA